MKQIDQIDALLPQTQCEECGYPGCRPYAKAIINDGESFELCAPGGLKTLNDLANVLKKDPKPFYQNVEQRYRPPATAIIREDECIGCTKCIQACPVDAIIGSAKRMHTIITSECTGCRLCVEPCPMDCIDIKAVANPLYDRENAKNRFEQRNLRLNKQHKFKQKPITKPISVSKKPSKASSIKEEIAAAVLRVKQKRKEKDQQK